MVIAASTLLIVAIVLGRKATINRGMGGMFTFVYLLYLIYLVLRG